MIVLRDFQRQLYDDVHAEWARGARNVLAVAPTGSGKTVLFSKIIHDHPGASIAIAHRNELVSQMSMSLARNGVQHRIIGQKELIRTCVGLHVSELRRSFYNPDAHHGVAGVDTLVKAKGMDAWFNRVSLWVQDECFVAGTLVDGRPIEAIRVGDTVTAFDEASGTFHQRPVARVFRNPAPENMVRVETKGHHVLCCTPEHPFWTRRGWVPAGQLSPSDEVLRHGMHAMRQPGNRDERGAEIPLSEDRQHLLYEKMRNAFQGVEAESRVVCQTGPSEPDPEDCAGGGREQPRFARAEGAGCEKGSNPGWVGLDSVEVYQRGDSGTAGPSSDDGYVYNLEVDEFHTYVANGVVVHNCHHLLAANKWGKATALFPNAKGLGVTATPIRADGRGLGRHADGLMDVMVESPGMRDLIRLGFLTEYRIFAPPSDINLANVPISAGGDFSPEPLRAAVHKSHIVGDTVAHYLRIAPVKLGVTFAVDVESATELAAAYRQAGVPSEVVSAKTPASLRASILRRFARGEVKQLVNVDLFGEGFDLPAIEAVSMARPTQSFALYAQQFGRSLRPMAGKSHAIIIDHVNNVLRHGLPDAPREWSLDRREKRARGKPDDVVPVRTCPECLSVYERIYRECPFCGHYPEPAGRSGPELVDGDLAELTPEALARLRGEIDKPLVLPYGAAPEVIGAVKKRYHERQQAQVALREAMARWGGVAVAHGMSLPQAQRKFYLRFNIDVAGAQALGRADAVALTERLKGDL